uniref:Galectin n=2 Tax=Hirondellea gigas TaxID=1518452 RepID=A0A6A7FNY0_9CRUS
MSAPVQNPVTPHLQPVPGGFVPGTIAHVTGTFTPGAASLIIKLQSGPGGDPADDVGLCLYGRVREGQLGRNSFTRAAGWGPEELAPGVQGLAPSMTFDVTIMCDPLQFKIAYNGKHVCEYMHRMNPASLSYLNVASLPGDLSLSCVWIEQSQNQAPAQPYAAPAPPPAYSAPSPAMPYNPNPLPGYAAPPGMAQPSPYPQQQQQFPPQQFPPQQQPYPQKANKMMGGSSGHPGGGGGYPGYGGGGGGGYPTSGGSYPGGPW